MGPMPMPPPPDLRRLDLPELARLAESAEAAPVDLWHPPHCGDSGMRIARDGTWWHMGSTIARPAMVRLFSRLLRIEPDGSHVLVTPVERMTIAVEDTPFLATDIRVDGSGREATIGFALNTGDVVIAGGDHPITPRPEAGATLPVRHQANGALLAALSRPVWLELAELGLAVDPPAVWSRGDRLPLS